MLRLDGRRDLLRRHLVEVGNWQVILGYKQTFDNGEIWAVPKPYTKTTVTYAVQIPVDFEVETIEGLHSAHAGDYLAIGPAGEMYPIAKDIFESSYKEAG